MKTTHQWVMAARGEDNLGGAFLLDQPDGTMFAVATDKHRLHITVTKRRPELDGIFFIDGGKHLTKEQYRKEFGELPDIQGVLKLIGPHDKLDFDLWMPAALDRVEHFEANILLNKEYMEEAELDGTWDCFTTGGEKAPVLFLKGDRKALIMPVVR